MSIDSCLPAMHLLFSYLALRWFSLCPQITTVHVDGPYKFTVTTNLPNYNFEHARFEIKGGAEVRFEVDGQFSFNYAESQARNIAFFCSLIT